MRARVQTTICRSLSLAFKDNHFALLAIWPAHRHTSSSGIVALEGHRALAREILARLHAKAHAKNDFANGQAAHAMRGHLPSWPPRRDTNAVWAASDRVRTFPEN